MDKLDEIKQCEDIVDWILRNYFSQLNVESKLYLTTLKSMENRRNRGFNILWYEKCYSEDQELAVQKVASHFVFLNNCAHGVIPIIILFFVGSWSDKRDKRKPCILGPILGELIAVTFLILSRNTPALLISLAYSLPTSISGGLPCLFLGVYSYVSTCSSGESLTMKIGGVSAIQKIAYLLGLGLSGIILKQLGLIGAYTTTFFMILSSFVYGYYIIEERKILVTDIVEKVHEIEEAPMKIEEKVHIFEHFLHTVRVLLTERPNNRRLRLIASVALLIIVNGPTKGEQSIFYLYTKYKFGWNHWQYGFFYGGQFLCETAGSLLTLFVLIKYFKWKDEALGLLAFMCSIISGIVFATATDSTWFSVGAILNLFDGTSQIALRSLMSKLVYNHELGKTNSIFQITEAVTHLMFGLFYTTLYEKTVHFCAGSIFLFSSGLKFIGIFIFIWLFRQSAKHGGKS